MLLFARIVHRIGKKRSSVLRNLRKSGTLIGSAVWYRATLRVGYARNQGNLSREPAPGGLCRGFVLPRFVNPRREAPLPRDRPPPAALESIKEPLCAEYCCNFYKFNEPLIVLSTHLNLQTFSVYLSGHTNWDSNRFSFEVYKHSAQKHDFTHISKPNRPRRPTYESRCTNRTHRMRFSRTPHLRFCRRSRKIVCCVRQNDQIAYVQVYVLNGVVPIYSVCLTP
jgi:hypothetical protein